MVTSKFLISFLYTATYIVHRIMYYFMRIYAHVRAHIFTKFRNISWFKKHIDYSLCMLRAIALIRSSWGCPFQMYKLVFEAAIADEVFSLYIQPPKKNLRISERQYNIIIEILIGLYSGYLQLWTQCFYSHCWFLVHSCTLLF